MLAQAPAAVPGCRVRVAVRAAAVARAPPCVRRALPCRQQVALQSFVPARLRVRAQRPLVCTASESGATVVDEEKSITKVCASQQRTQHIS